jgi:5-methylcytosine-specific restriction endonuclease McrA
MLDGHVLILNRSWAAVHIAPVSRALTQLYVGTADAVHPRDYSLHDFDEWLEISSNGMGGRYIHTPNLRIRIPEVLLLRDFNRFIRREVRFSRDNIFERDNNTCQYCGRHLTKPNLTLDHIVPQSRGGGDTWENLAVACVPCNVRKGNRTPSEANMNLLRKPSKPSWMPNFGKRVPEHQLEVWQRFVDTRRWGIASANTA